MPKFSTPFDVMHSDRKLTKEEVIRSVRFSIAAEYESTQLYEQLAESIDDENAKKILYEIANDEKVHAGNFLELLNILDPNEQKAYEQGKKEVLEILGE